MSTQSIFKHIIIFWALINISFAQINLVPNFSFENTTACPFYEDIELASPWYSPTTGTPDLFNSCDTVGMVGVPTNWAGTELPQTGNGYCGIYTFSSTQVDVREYIQVGLDTAMIIGKTYIVEFYVSLAEYSTFAANDIGAYFSASPIGSSDYYVLPYIPQIANSNNPLTSINGWAKVSGSFVASGGEKYITIGNFKNNANTDTVTVNSGNQWNYTYYYIDDVLVMEDTSNTINDLSSVLGLSFFPNPNDGSMSLFYNINQNEKAVLNIYDVNGKLLFKQILLPENDMLEISNSQFESGIYYYNIVINDETTINKKLVIIK